MTSNSLSIDLEFKQFEEALHNQVGIYIRTLRHFSEAIDYVGSAGESPRSNFNTRLTAHKKRYKKGASTYLRFRYDESTQGSLHDYLALWQKTVASSYDPAHIFIPGMPLSYERNDVESLKISADIWNVWVAPLDSVLPRLQEKFETRRASLRAVEAKLQTLLRSFYVQESQNLHFPLEVHITGRPGESNTRSLLLGDTRTADLINSDLLHIRKLSLPFETAFAKDLKAFVESTPQQKRSDKIKWILATVDNRN